MIRTFRNSIFFFFTNKSVRYQDSQVQNNDKNLVYYVHIVITTTLIRGMCQVKTNMLMVFWPNAKDIFYFMNSVYRPYNIRIVVETPIRRSCVYAHVIITHII